MSRERIPSSSAMSMAHFLIHRTTARGPSGALDRMIAANVPWCLLEQEPEPETEHLLHGSPISHPFISENGGGISSHGYFPFPLRACGGFELRRDRPSVDLRSRCRRALPDGSDAASTSPASARGASRRCTGVRECAARCPSGKLREYDEPLSSSTRAGVRSRCSRRYAAEGSVVPRWPLRARGSGADKGSACLGHRPGSSRGVRPLRHRSRDG